MDFMLLHTSRKLVTMMKERSITLACKKKNTQENFHSSVSFFPAEYDYESHFSHHVQIFWNFVTKV